MTLQSDLKGVTVTMNPPRRPEDNEGYFEYVEGPMGVGGTIQNNYNINFAGGHTNTNTPYNSLETPAGPTQAQVLARQYDGWRSGRYLDVHHAERGSPVCRTGLGGTVWVHQYECERLACERLVCERPCR